MKGAGVDNGGPVRSLCVCPSFNTAPEAALCFDGGSHEGRVSKCYGNVIGFEDFGYMEM